MSRRGRVSEVPGVSGLDRTIPVLLVVSSLLPGIGCQTSDVVPEPTADLLAVAIASAARRVDEAAEGDGETVWWMTGAGQDCQGELVDSSDSMLCTGQVNGVAGIARGLLEGALELRRTESDAGVSTYGDPLSPALGAARFLLGSSCTSATGRYWYETLPVDETGAVLDPCPPLPEVDGFDGQVVPGLASGVAGVGEFLLFLTLGLEKRYPEYALAATSTDDPTPFSTSTGNAALEVGDWLVDNAREDASGLCWPADLAAAGTAGCDLSIADGNAGIGAFLFGLATYADARVAAGETSLAGRGELYRSTASAAADFIVGQLQAGSCDTTCSYAFLNGQATTGLYHGNAGLAWYLLKTGLETGLTTYREPAEAILTWLKQDFNRKAVDEGVAWRGTPRSTGASSSDDTLLTDLENGTAGIAWVYLQASLVLDAQKDSSKTQAAGGIDAVSIKNDAWFEEARAAAQWLQGGETAHLFGGAVWWPAEVTPWGVSQYEANWCTDALEVSTDDFRSALVYYPGFMRGGAGIGRFFNVMAGSSLQRNCYRELADQATRWLYYRGENRSWRWPSRVLRFLNTDECSLEPINLETALGYGYGSAGIIAALAEDRFGDEQPLCPAYATILTLPSLATPAEGDVCLE